MNYSWYSQVSDQISADKVQQALAYGSLDEIMLLKKEIGEEKLSQIFLNHPKKLYSKSSLNFIQKFILHLDNQINEVQYLKDAPRNIRP